MNDSTKEAVIVICPPHSDYPYAPEDQPKCQLFDCPKCKEKMWLSGKKRGALMFYSCLGRKIILACYHCFKKMVEENPSLILESEQVNL